MKPPAFQFYADDFLAGVMNMTNEERGLYIVLLCIQWNRGYVTMDDFNDFGAQMSEASIQRVLKKFRARSNRLFNSRMEHERRKLKAFRANRSESGLKGAEKRWHSHSSAMQQPMAKHGFVSPLPSVSVLPTSKTSKLPAKLKKWPRHKAEIVSRFEACLAHQWENDRSKWLGNIDRDWKKSERIVAELENAIKESRVKTTPAQYAEQLWKEFE